MSEKNSIQKVIKKYDRLWYNPDAYGYTERTPFLQSLCGEYAQEPLPLEDLVVNASRVNVRVDSLTLELANSYIEFRRRGARLPNFGRWCTGMFRDNKIISRDLAEAGKTQDTTTSVVISCGKNEILKGGQSAHFYSCLNPSTGFEDVLPKIVESYPGIAIAFIPDRQRDMYRGRVWMHHAKIHDTGEDIVVLAGGYGTLRREHVAAILKAKHNVRVFDGRYSYNSTPKDVRIDYVGCPDEAIHWDTNTWDCRHGVEFL